MGIKLNSCIDCGNKADDRQLDILSIRRSIESQRSERKYLKDHEIQQIRLECNKEAKELEKVRTIGQCRTQEVEKLTPVYVNLKLQDLIEAAKNHKESIKKPCNLVEKVKKKGTIERDGQLRYRNI